MTADTAPAPQPEPGTLRDAELIELRHNARTPVNHILGYAEMLIEDASAAGKKQSLELLRTIEFSARAVLSSINEALANRDSIAFAEVERLCENIRPRVERIRHSLDELGRAPENWAAPDWPQDLQRIRSAATSLVALLSYTRPPESSEEPQEAPTAQPAGSGARLLVVDDNSTNRHILCRRLKRQGYAVASARNGSEALDRVATEHFDLVLLDIMMPVMDGFEVLTRMKEDRRMRAIPVVIISALDEMAGVVRAIQIGAEDYLFKPFDPVLLRARIGALLEKKRLREELSVQEKLASLGALTAGVAHEIKNPLNFVMNFSEICADLVHEQAAILDRVAGKLAPEEVQELREIASDLEQNIGKVREHGARADSIIRAMLAHSRGQPGERRATDLNALVREYVNLAFHGMRAQDNSFQADIQGSYDPEVGMVDVIPQDLSRVFLNIASNAFYAIRKKSQAGQSAYIPTIRITTRNYGETVEVRIWDNGVGIPSAVLDRIFDPFFTTKAAGEGTGLGLSISYEIVVQEHRGEMQVDSREGDWTEFTLKLPRRFLGQS